MKKNGKNLLAMLMALVMVFAAGCGVAAPEQESIDSSVQLGDTEARETTLQETKQEITLTETVLYDEGGIVITATGLADGFMGPEVKLLLENNSTASVVITADSVSVNGYMLTLSGLYAQVAAGKKSNESLTLMTSELDQAGITTISQIQLFFRIQDNERLQTVAESGLITISTSAKGYEQPVDDSGEVLYEENGIKIVSKGLMQNSVWEGTVVFYMENTSGQPITVYAEEVSVNGFMQTVSLWADLRDGTRRIDGMHLLDLSELELNSLDEVERIEFRLRIVNADTWQELVTTDVITLTFG